MNNPTLVRTKVVIDYTASDGYRMEFGAKAGRGSKNRRTGEEVPPQHALLEALEELARITALFGFEDQALVKFEEARARVAEWKATGGGRGMSNKQPKSRSDVEPLTDEQERKNFEQWYVCNAFDYERNPIGSRECGLQWSSWKARAAHGIKGDA